MLNLNNQKWSFLASRLDLASFHVYTVGLVVFSKVLKWFMFRPWLRLLLSLSCPYSVTDSYLKGQKVRATPIFYFNRESICNLLNIISDKAACIIFLFLSMCETQKITNITRAWSTWHDFQVNFPNMEYALKICHSDDYYEMHCEHFFYIKLIEKKVTWSPGNIVMNAKMSHFLILTTSILIFLFVETFIVTI